MGDEVGREIGCEMRMREMRENERGKDGGWKREGGVRRGSGRVKGRSEAGRECSGL